MTVAILSSLMIYGATVFNPVFDDANAAYKDGNYDKAVKLYEQLVSEGVESADLFYNLGNAYYRQNRLGPAIANYERALHLRPGFDFATRNLQQCLAQTKRQLSAPLPPPWQQALLFWHKSLTPQFSFRMAALCWIALWVVLAVRLWRPLPYLRRTALVFAVLAVFFGLSSWVKVHPALVAVANHDGTQVRYGIGTDETVRFELFTGDRVQVDKRANGWVRVATAGGERGWVQDSSLSFVGPPYLRAPEPTAGPEEGHT